MILTLIQTLILIDIVIIKMKSTKKSTSKSAKKQNSGSKSAEKKMNLKDKLNQQMLQSVRKVSNASHDLNPIPINYSQLNQAINKSDIIKIEKILTSIEQKDSRIKQLVSKILAANIDKFIDVLIDFIQQGSMNTLNKILCCKIIQELLTTPEKLSILAKNKLQAAFAKNDDHNLTRLLNISGKLELLQN